MTDVVNPDISDNTECPEEKPKLRRVPLKEKVSATISLEDLQHLQLSRAQFNQIRKARKDPTEKQKKDEEAIALLKKRQESMAKAREKMLEMKKTKEEAQLLAKEKAKEKAKEYAKNKDHVDIRKDKTVDGVVVKIAPPRKRVIKPKVESESESEDESEEEEKPKFHARKPNLDDPIEQKVNKLNQLNQALSGNPFYAQIMASRGRY
jgi:hypothetical protein